ncbi:MAG: hypothetical protein GTO60_17465, partial [Gammaproteobacteria bacterium]|nr:hypothetical protein [Gammaproteobacteria bacterium]
MIVNCIITHNHAYYASGGGIYCWDHASPKIIGCTISNNEAKYDAGGVNFYGGTPMLVNCI